MTPARTIPDLEADIAALRAAAERAGTALACLFSTSDEFEAAVVKVRREQGAYRRQQRGRYAILLAALTGVLALVLL